jgi:hypothetical protein
MTLWLVIAALTVKHVALGTLFVAPCLAELEKAAVQGAEDSNDDQDEPHMDA